MGTHVLLGCIMPKADVIPMDASQSDLISMDDKDADSLMLESVDDEFKLVTHRVAEAG